MIYGGLFEGKFSVELKECHGSLHKLIYTNIC
jgi:hypothetical protein